MIPITHRHYTQAALDFVNEDAGSIILIARSESKLLELKRTLEVVTEPERADIVAFPCGISNYSSFIRLLISRLI